MELRNPIAPGKSETGIMQYPTNSHMETSNTIRDLQLPN